MKSLKLGLGGIVVLGIAFLTSNFAFADGIENRLDNQQQRIDKGVSSGNLTQGQANRLDARDKAINAEYNHDVQKNGGKLTPAQHHRLKRRTKRTSKRIHHDKHTTSTASSTSLN